MVPALRLVPALKFVRNLRLLRSLETIETLKLKGNWVRLVPALKLVHILGSFHLWSWYQLQRLYQLVIDLLFISWVVGWLASCGKVVVYIWQSKLTSLGSGSVLYCCLQSWHRWSKILGLQFFSFFLLQSFWLFQITFGTSGQRCSWSPSRQSTGNNVSGHYFDIHG